MHRPSRATVSGRPRRRGSLLSPWKICVQRRLDGASRPVVSGDCTLTSRPPTFGRAGPSSHRRAMPGHRVGRGTGDAATDRAGANIREDMLDRSGAAAAAVRNRRLLFISPSSPKRIRPGQRRRLLTTPCARNGRPASIGRSVPRSAKEIKPKYSTADDAAAKAGDILASHRTRANQAAIFVERRGADPHRVKAE